MTMQVDVFLSLLEEESSVNPNSYIEFWLQKKNQEVAHRISIVGLSALNGWYFEPISGYLRHTSGKFFSIEAVRVTTSWPKPAEWCQPIINQPEVGILGFLAKRINGRLHVLLQAKIEPGNVNVVQLSPTLQATKSNYTQTHGGRRPSFLEYFNGEKKVSIIYDQLQSEQGGRFLKKRNRNMLVVVDDSEDITVPENFLWLTLGQVKKLLLHNNLVNMDSRTVLGCINVGSFERNALDLIVSANAKDLEGACWLRSFASDESAIGTLTDALSWISSIKAVAQVGVEKIPISHASGWKATGEEFVRDDRRYFSVVGVDVEIENREVTSWSQPMIKPADCGLIGFIVKKIDGVYHLLVQARHEAGIFDMVEIGPTIQCIPVYYTNGLNSDHMPFLDYFLKSGVQKVLYDTCQSEEGGRFYHEQNRHMIVEVDDKFDFGGHANFRWITIHQLTSIAKYSNMVNIGARSLVSAIPLLGWKN